MRRLLKILVPVLILAAGAAGVAVLVFHRPEVEARPPETPPRLVRTVTANPETVRFVVRAHGTVVPHAQSELVAQVAGEVTWVSDALVSGGFFEKGEPLVRIDRTDHEIELESARAAVARAQSERARARKELERQRRLRDRDITSEARIDDAENAYRVTEAALREARARLARAERDLERTELTAPYDGRVRSEDVDAGQFVGRGTPVATLYATDYAEVRLPLPDRELAFLSLPLSYAPGAGNGAGKGGASAPANGDRAAGPEVVLHADFAGASRSWTGRVVRTEGEIDPRTRMVQVVARVDDPYGREADGDRPPLAVGLFVEAEILGRSVEGAYRLPREALREGDQVLVVDDESRLRFRDVQVLRTVEDEVVIGRGLEPGERVCVSPLQAPVDGMEVRVADDAAGPELARRPS